MTAPSADTAELPRVRPPSLPPSSAAEAPAPGEGGLDGAAAAALAVALGGTGQRIAPPVGVAARSIDRVPPVLPVPTVPPVLPVPTVHAAPPVPRSERTAERLAARRSRRRWGLAALSVLGAAFGVTVAVLVLFH